MKWKILSAVVALHLVVGGGLLLSGGCKNPAPASPKGSVIPANTPVGPSSVTPAPTIVTTTDSGAPVVNPGSTNTTVVDPSLGGNPADTNSINNGLGSAINGKPAGLEGGSSYTVAKGDSLSRIAKKHGTTSKAILEANNLKSDNLKVGQTLVIPGAGAIASGLASSDTVKAPATTGEHTEYTVVKNDSLDRIAKKFGVSVSDLKAANNLKSDTVRLGQSLKVPGKHDLKTLGSSAPAPKKPSAPAVVPEGGSSYTVKTGDTADVIARRHGMTTKDLLALNGNLDPKKLKVGQKLVVKGSASGPATPVPSKDAPAKPVPAGGPATPVPATPVPATTGGLPPISLSGPAAPAPASPVPNTAAPVIAAPSVEAIPVTPVAK